MNYEDDLVTRIKNIHIPIIKNHDDWWSGNYTRYGYMYNTAGMTILVTENYFYIAPDCANFDCCVDTKFYVIMKLGKNYER